MSQKNEEKVNSIVLKVDNQNMITIDETTKITGLMSGKFICPLIDKLDLEANPRESKTGNTTAAIQESLEKTPELFPFKSKGLLLASSGYEFLDRGRIKLTPNDLSIEGILDGGHNTLAIGLFILGKAYDYAKKSLPTGQINWKKFKELWTSSADIISDYLISIANKESENVLDFYIPVEILIPSDKDNDMCIRKFTRNLLQISEARNNNAELNLSTRDNQNGYFEDLKRFLYEESPEIYNRVEWKTNDGGDIKVADLIALAWIPLSLVTPVKDVNGRTVDPVSPNTMYSSKGSCLKQFDRLMSSPQVTKDSENSDYKQQLINSEVKSALKIAAQLPAMYDYIYENFPSCYNAAGGCYGKITAVSGMNKSRKTKVTPFGKKEISTLSPDGFITPIIYGMIALLENKEIDGEKVIVWKQSPMPFLIDNLSKIVKKYFGLIELCDYDPQKVGKATQSYHQTEETVNNLFTEIQLKLLMNKR